VQLQNITSQLAGLKSRGYEVIIVSSGAIAAGVEGLGLQARPTAIPELQAAASVGQGLLLHEYATLFNKYNLRVGQVLLTQFDIIHRQQYLNSRNALSTLLDLGIVPIVNENDVTAVDEIRFGDNDTLAALVANLVQADVLVLLSDIDGLYTCDPRKQGEDACLIDQVTDITDDIAGLAGGAGTHFGSGGMVTKLQAARIAVFGKVGMFIANGRKENILVDIMDRKAVGTFFVPRAKGLSAHKLWIAFGKATDGTITVDDGAANALIRGGKSLLPAGIVASEGQFEGGDAVDIKDLKGRIFAKGITNYSFEEVTQIKGLQSAEVLSQYPDFVDEEVIHRDCLVILR
jgi:glutamate 5-kinase